MDISHLLRPSRHRVVHSSLISRGREDTQGSSLVSGGREDTQAAQTEQLLDQLDLLNLSSRLYVILVCTDVKPMQVYCKEKSVCHFP